MAERNKDLDFWKGETPLGDHHPIHPSMEAHLMIISMHVLTMDRKLELAKVIARLMKGGFIKTIEEYLLEDKTKSHIPMIT